MSDIIIDELIRSKRRTISIIVDRDGKVLVRAPKRASAKYINEVIISKKSWIEKKKKEILERTEQRPDKKFTEGEEFLYLGQTYKLLLEEDSEYYLKFTGSNFILDAESRHYGKDVFAEWYRRQAAVLFRNKAEDISGNTGIRYNQLKISNARKRWGSCSSKGNLNFSWRLVMAPEKMITYVICHEMAHLVVMNHSPKFWKIVGKMYPDYKACIKWFNENGHLLDI